MQSVLISIRSEYVKQILTGKKTIEIRKSFPQCQLPCKVFVYCSKGKYGLTRCFMTEEDKINNKWTYQDRVFGWADGNLIETLGKIDGEVVAEFTLNKVSTFDYDIDFENDKQKMYYIRSGELEKTCLTYDELLAYGQGKTLYGWHIDDLKVYNELKDIRQFKRQCPGWEPMTYENIGCLERSCPIHELGECDGRCIYLDRPPQSWCYVE